MDVQKYREGTKTTSTRENAERQVLTITITLRLVVTELVTTTYKVKEVQHAMVISALLLERNTEGPKIS
jgi:hypothetical protein